MSGRAKALVALGSVVSIWATWGAWRSYDADCQFLIPDGYVGPVVIAFDHPAGTRGPSWWHRPVYVIGHDGILRISDPQRHSVCINPSYWWIGTNGRTPLREYEGRPPQSAGSAWVTGMQMGETTVAGNTRAATFSSITFAVAPAVVNPRVYIENPHERLHEIEAEYRR